MQHCGAIPRRYFTRSTCSNGCCQSPPSWTFAPNLRNSACRGRAHGRTETFGTSSTQQHWLRAMSATLAKQFARCCLELARSAKTATHRARFTQMAHEYWLASLRICEELSSDLRPGGANHHGGTNWRSDGSVNPPTLLDHPRPIAQRDFDVRPALHRRPVSLQRDEVVADGGNLLDQGLAGRVVPAVNGVGMVGHGPSMRSRVAD